MLWSIIITILHRYDYINFSDTYIPKIVCSHEEKEDLGTCNQNVEDVNREHDEHNGKELELMVSVLGCHNIRKDESIYASEMLQYWPFNSFN